MIKCVIIDDEQLARQLLENYLIEIPDIELCGSFKNPLSALTVLEEKEIDFILLDIQMPEIKGTDFLRTLSKKPHVIFTTAYQEYALEGYELEVIDYLLKPISFERFLKAVNKVKKRIGSAEDDFIIIKSGTTMHKVFYKNLFHIEGFREYVIFHTDDEKIVSLESMKQLELTLPADQFIRIHKSHIVNFKRISHMKDQQIILNAKEVPVGKSYLKEVKEKIFNS